MTLQSLYYLATALSFTAAAVMFASLLLMSLAASRDATVTVKTASVKIKDGDVRITDPSRSTERMRKISRLLLIPGLFVAGSALMSIILFSYYNHMALSHGATDDYKTTSTIGMIRDRSAHMFIDQSDELPDDLSGCVLIFFRYTCQDCYDTHDQIVSVLERENVDNVYFVSSKSAAAEERGLIDMYGVEAVPWGVYIETDGEPSVTDILYDEFENEASEKFVEENLMKIISAQKGENAQ